MINFVKVRTKTFSLKTKFTLIAIVISLVSFGVAAYFSTRWLAIEIEGDYKEKAILIGTHIIHDLESSMLHRPHGEILPTLDLYKSYKDVEQVRIFNTRSKEVFVKGESSPEAGVEEVIRTGEPLSFPNRIKNREATTFIIPIRNKPECHGCHEKSEPLRGALLLSLNQTEMKRYIGQQEQRFFILFGLIAAGTIFTTVIAVKRFFLNPLTAIQEGAEAIGKGDFTYQVPVGSRDEIGNLTENFNRMAQTLQNSFKEISRSKKEWEETFDRINDPIVVVDSDCNILKANRAFQETFAKIISLPEMINRKCSELLGTCLLTDCPHQISMRDRIPVTREIHSEKTGKIFEVSTFPYYSPAEVFKGSVAVMKDVTEKKENEMRLMMSERLAALGEMASGIAHEINNPLGTIAACTEALLNRMEKEKIGSILFENYLRIIQDEINRCKNITNSMLSFVKKREDKKLHVEVNEIVEKTLEMVNFQGRLKDVEVLRQYQEEIPAIHYDEGNLRQAFLSIIANAVDAMEGKGTLTIETGTIPPILTLEKSVRLEAEGGSPHGVENRAPQGKGGFVFIKISDTGPGIPQHLINRIFDPFFTTKSKKGGTGLGLSIADKIIQENNGKIDVVSEEGKGTTFTITLPI